MSPRILLLAMTALAVAGPLGACSGGAGTPAPIPGGSREPSGRTHDPGSPGPEPAGPGYEQPGGAASSGSSSPPPATCPACDQTYACIGIGDAGATETVVLVTANGV